MGIAAGVLDGGGVSTLKGPLMSRGAREVARLIKALGGNELSAYGLAPPRRLRNHSLFPPFAQPYVRGNAGKGAEV